MLVFLMVAAGPEGLPDEQARAYALIRPGEKDLPWRKLGWKTDLEAAVKLAKEEKRPLLLWVAGDPPLERC
jgi:hypothetical protein